MTREEHVPSHEAGLGENGEGRVSNNPLRHAGVPGLLRNRAISSEQIRANTQCSLRSRVAALRDGRPLLRLCRTDLVVPETENRRLSQDVHLFLLHVQRFGHGKSRVVGYCYVKPIIQSGKIVVQGASYQWDEGKLSKRVGYRSNYVYGTQDDDEETTCHIQFTIDENQEERLYRHGLLQFRLADRGDDLMRKGGKDAYVGYLQSTRRGSELQDVEVRSKGYAELYSEGVAPEDEARLALTRRGDALFGILDAILRTTPQPSLWPAEDLMLPESLTIKKTNCWGHQIPTPQSVILNGDLRSHIDTLLTNMLSLTGLSSDAIEEFKKYAITQARLDPEDIQSAYERSLKKELVDKKIDWKMDETLTQRATIISKQIIQFLAGDSLLDIGCGNGLITDLIRQHFNRIQCLDVVRYMPASLKLPFLLYKDGEPLPIDNTFDTVLLLTVLHHSNNPIELLKMAWAATTKRLIIIESVVGVHKAEPHVRYDLAGASDENQIAYAAFVDWFYNRVLHDDVPVPYNFTTPERWQSTFLQHGMRLLTTMHLGQDIDIGPEYHVLFVLEK